jgi:hypothetical protein
LTLDHHTDTSRPFRHYLKSVNSVDRAEAEHETALWLAQIDYRKPASVHTALERLNNDEHIVAAIARDIVSSAFVIAHSAMNTDLAVYREHKIMCRAVDQGPESRKATREECDQVLESAFLEEMLASFDHQLAAAGEPPLLSKPYILDIDLDYFNTRASVAPRDARVIRRLAHGASLISIATEPSYVSHCALDPELTSDTLLVALQTLLATGAQP